MEEGKRKNESEKNPEAISDLNEDDLTEEGRKKRKIEADDSSSSNVINKSPRRSDLPTEASPGDDQDKNVSEKNPEASSDRVEEDFAAEGKRKRKIEADDSSSDVTNKSPRPRHSGLSTEPSSTGSQKQHSSSSTDQLVVSGTGSSSGQSNVSSIKKELARALIKHHRKTVRPRFGGTLSPISERSHESSSGSPSPQKSHIPEFKAMRLSDEEKKETLEPSADELRNSAKFFFQIYDVDKDGFLTTDELGPAMSAFGEPRTEAELKVIVNNEVKPGGKINLEDFVDLMKRHSADDSISLQRVIESFEWFDYGCSGFLPTETMRSILTKNGGDAMTDEEVDMMIIEARRGSDGQIDYREFAKKLCSPD